MIANYPDFGRNSVQRRPWKAFGRGGTSASTESNVPRYDPALRSLLRRAQGWLDFAQHVQKARKQTNPDLFIGNDRAPASMMQFYLPDRPFVYVQPEAYGKSQFGLSGRAIQLEMEREHSLLLLEKRNCHKE